MEGVQSKSMGKLATGGDESTEELMRGRGRSNRIRKTKPISVLKSSLKNMGDETDSDRTESENSLKRVPIKELKIDPNPKTVVVEPRPDIIPESSDESQTRRRRRGRKVMDDHRSNSSQRSKRSNSQNSESDRSKSLSKLSRHNVRRSKVI